MTSTIECASTSTERSAEVHVRVRHIRELHVRGYRSIVDERSLRAVPCMIATVPAMFNNDAIHALASDAGPVVLTPDFEPTRNHVAGPWSAPSSRRGDR